MTYKHRIEMLELVNDLGCKTAVEIGTHRGGFAYFILKNTGVKQLTCIDPWTGEFYPHRNPEDRYQECLDRLSEFGDRVRIMRTVSLQAVHRFEENSLDFVYIDARHRYEHVIADMRAWWPKLKVNGLFAGHDHYSRHGCGVPRACQEFIVDDLGREYQLTGKEAHPTWYLVK